MAEIQAFRGFRYDLGRVGSLSDVIAPPYDVIDASLQQALYDKSPYNVIRLILNKQEPSDSDDNNRYTRAAKVLRDWQREDVLVQDTARSLYLYHQEFEVEGKKYNRRGFMARVRLERFGEGRIYPHEQTMSGPKEDRFRLTKATGMNLSQIFGLFPDPENAVQNQLDEAVKRDLPVQATDHLGVVHKLWPVTDQHVVSTVAGLMGPKPVFIADGHHRYETALRYQEDRKQAGEIANDDAPPNFVLMMLVSMQDPGLAILPTHRLISDVGDMTSDELTKLLSSHFHVEKVGQGDKAAQTCWESIEADGGQSILGFGTTVDQTWHLARLNKPETMAELAPEQSAAWRGLAVSVLQKAVLEHLLPQAGRNPPKPRYVHLLSEVTDAMGSKECQLAALVPPATMEHVQEIAGNLEKMPPKSTYFYPKLLSGMVFHSLKSN